MRMSFYMMCISVYQCIGSDKGKRGTTKLRGEPVERTKKQFLDGNHYRRINSYIHTLIFIYTHRIIDGESHFAFLKCLMKIFMISMWNTIELNQFSGWIDAGKKIRMLIEFHF